MSVRVAVSIAIVLAGCAGSLRSLSREARDEELAVRAVIERWADAINRHDWTVLDRLLTDDAVWEARPPIGWRHEGRTAIHEALTRNLASIEMLDQTVTAIVVEVDGERASARHTLIEHMRLRETGVAMRVVGIYEDELARGEDGAWRFVRRSFQLRYEDEVDAPDRIVDRASPGSSRSVLH